METKISEVGDGIYRLSTYAQGDDGPVLSTQSADGFQPTYAKRGKGWAVASGVKDGTIDHLSQDADQLPWHDLKRPRPRISDCAKGSL